MGVKPTSLASGLAGAFLLALFLSTGAVLGQSTMVGGRMEAVLALGPEAIPVSMDYRILPGPGVRAMGFSILLTGPARVDSLRAFREGAELPVALRELRPGYWTGEVSLDLPVSGSGQMPPPGATNREGEEALPTTPPEPLEVRLTYVVKDAWEGEGRVVLPTVALEWVPSDPHPRTFIGELLIPRGLSVVESFPTSVTSRPESSEGGAYEVALQGVPALLMLRTVTGEPPFLTLERSLDAFVILLLIIMGVVGVRFLRGGGG